MVTHEHRKELQKALKSSIKQNRTKKEAIEALIKIGILTNDGKPSPNYYPQKS